MKRKSLLFILVLALMAFSFTACTEDQKNAANGGDKKTSGTEKEVKLEDTASKLTYAYFNTINLENFGFNAELGVKGDFTALIQEQMASAGDAESKKYAAFANELINNGGIAYNMKYKFEEGSKFPMFSMGYGLNYNKKPLLDFAVFSDNKNVGFNLPAVSKKGFAMSYSKIFEDVDQEELEAAATLANLDYKKYFNLVLEDKSSNEFYEANFADYKVIVDKYLNDNFDKGEEKTIERDGKKIDVTEFTANLDYASYKQFTLELLKKAKDDDKLRDLVIKKMTVVVDEFIESKDYESFGMTEEEAQKFKSEFHLSAVTNREEFDKEWVAGMEEAIEAYENEEMDEETKAFLDQTVIKWVVRVDKDNHLDSMHMEFTVKPDGTDQEIQVIIDGNYLLNVDIAQTDNENFINIDGLADENVNPADYLKENKDVAEFIKTYALEVMDYVLEGDTPSEIYQLMKDNDMESEESMIKTLVEQTKSQLESMTTEQLIESMQ